MAKNRCIYLAVLLSATVFYLANRQWLGWLLLLAAALLPVLSLALSLPGLAGARIGMTCPGTVPCGDEVFVQLTNGAWLSVPVRGWVISVYKPLTKTEETFKDGQPLPTEHCGKLFCCMEKVRMTDYLGLFSFSLRPHVTATVTVWPKPVTLTQPPQLQQHTAAAWKPKPGGGFAENHEVRLYRPGDKLNQIHWKLSAKTGKLMLREPMIPAGRQAVVGLCLCGTQEQLDLKFGKLMGVCAYLKDMGVPFEVRAQTATGIASYTVGSEQDMTEALDALLGMEPAQEESVASDAQVYWIGGDSDDQ